MERTPEQLTPQQIVALEFFCLIENGHRYDHRTQQLRPTERISPKTRQDQYLQIARPTGLSDEAIHGIYQHELNEVARYHEQRGPRASHHLDLEQSGTTFASISNITYDFSKPTPSPDHNPHRNNTLRHRAANYIWLMMLRSSLTWGLWRRPKN